MNNVKTKKLTITLLSICLLLAIAVSMVVFGGINSQVAYAAMGCEIKLYPCVGAPVTTVSELSLSYYSVVESFDSLTWRKYNGSEWVAVAEGEVFSSGVQYEATLKVTFKDSEIDSISTVKLDEETKFAKTSEASVPKTMTLTKTYTIGNELILDLNLTQNQSNPTYKLVWDSIVVNGKLIYTYRGIEDTSTTRCSTYLTYKLKKGDIIKVKLQPEKSNAVIVEDKNAGTELSKSTSYTLEKDTTVSFFLDAFYVNRGYYVTVNLLNAPTSDKFTITDSMNAAGDGKIEGITDEMEYRKEGETTYTSGVTGTAVTDLPAGKYYVRYKAVGFWPASDEIKLEVGSAKVRVKYQEGKTFNFYIYTNPEGCLPGETVTLLFVEQDGFEFTGNPVVKIGGVNYTFTRDDTYNNGTFCYCKYTCKTGALNNADALEVQELVSGYVKKSSGSGSGSGTTDSGTPSGSGSGSGSSTNGSSTAGGSTNGSTAGSGTTGDTTSGTTNSGTISGTDTDKGNQGLQAGAVVGIVFGILIFLLLLAYVLGYFFLYRKHKLDDKAIKVIYSFLPQDRKEEDEKVEKAEEKQEENTEEKQD